MPSARNRRSEQVVPLDARAVRVVDAKKVAATRERILYPRSDVRLYRRGRRRRVPLERNERIR